MAAKPQSFGAGSQLSQALLPEFDQEMQTTRRTLERVPEDKLAWKPHEKSMSLGQLATHLATMGHWADAIAGMESFDVSTAPPTPKLNSRAEILAAFDSSTATAHKAIAATTDSEMVKPWTLRAGDKSIFTLPRVAVFRSFILNHLIHHRGQLSVYLRLNNVPVPSIYGPSADEGQF
jgi:uncharacterized damage-inducible protein DinB